MANFSNEGSGRYNDDWVPEIGMEFPTELAAYNFYLNYGHMTGFGVRKDYLHWCDAEKTIIKNRKFVCHKAGIKQVDKRGASSSRAETRTDCQVYMIIRRTEEGGYKCTELEVNHNHELQHSSASHFLRSHRNMDSFQQHEIDLADQAGVTPKNIFEMMTLQAGGADKVNCTHKDVENYLQAKRQRALQDGEAQSLLNYFQAQSRLEMNYFSDYQLDSDNQIRNIFWADAEMRADYFLFGDVIAFDTTFGTNRNCRPFGVFVGFNHYRSTVIFGAALMYDETADSFQWLFETFLKAHNQKRPLTIFTDQDAAMGKAISITLPETYHGLCTFHIMNNAAKHMTCHGEGFFTELKRCMYGYESVEEFESAWELIVQKYQSRKSAWLDRIYAVKQKWAHCYMKHALTLGMRSTQLSESLNAAMKKYLQVRLDVMRFFEKFERVVRDKRNKEQKDQYECCNKISKISQNKSPILRHAREVYTPTILAEFDEEHGESLRCSIKMKEEDSSPMKYLVSSNSFLRKGDFMVLCDANEQLIKCSCRKFESYGILCAHALKIFERLDIKKIPELYIMRRWTKTARNVPTMYGNERNVEAETDFDATARYKYLSSHMSQLALKASQVEGGYEMVNESNIALEHNLELLCSKVCGVRINEDRSTEEEPHSLIQPSGIARKEKHRRSGKRQMSWTEKTSKSKSKRTPVEVSRFIQPGHGLQSDMPESYPSFQGSCPSYQNMTYSSQASSSMDHFHNVHAYSTMPSFQQQSVIYPNRGQAIPEEPQPTQDGTHMFPHNFSWYP